MLKVTVLNGAEPGFEPCLISKAGFFFSAVLSVVIDHHAPPPRPKHRSLISLACLSTSLSFSHSFSLSACLSPLPLSLSALVGLLTLVFFFSHVSVHLMCPQVPQMYPQRCILKSEEEGPGGTLLLGAWQITETLGSMVGAACTWWPQGVVWHQWLDWRWGWA